MKDVSKILCPVDFSEASAVALRSAQELAHRFGAKLLVAHVLDEPAYSVEQAGGSRSALVSEYESNMKTKLREFTSELDRSLTVEVLTARGSAAETIAKLAGQEGCDLIVMGTHGRTGLRHVLIGSVTERVLRLSDVPVLTMRAQTGRTAAPA
jgi:nucleotide-binding universal stress UspA family protein